MSTPTLDKLDQKLLGELFKNARASNSGLGKQLHASKEVINYRINRLLKEGIISKFIPIINFSCLGYTIYRVQLKFLKRDKAKEKEFFSSIKNTSWMVDLHGNWDLVVLFWIKSPLEFFRIVDEINLFFKENIQQSQTTIVNAIHYSHATSLEQKNQLRFSYLQKIYEGEQLKLDEIDQKIIEELLKDGRIPLLEIARKIGSSATNVNYHLKKMIDQKIILGFIPQIDYTKLGLTHYKINLKLINPGQKKELLELTRSSVNTIYITESYGNYDFEFEWVTENINNLFVFLEEIAKVTPMKEYEIIFNNQELLINEVPFHV